MTLLWPKNVNLNVMALQIFKFHIFQNDLVMSRIRQFLGINQWPSTVHLADRKMKVITLQFANNFYKRDFKRHHMNWYLFIWADFWQIGLLSLQLVYKYF